MKIANDLNFYSTSSKNNSNNSIKKQYKFSKPNFQGVLEEQFLKEAIAKKSLPAVETIMNKISAFMGLSLVKTRRMFEALLKTLNDSISENAILNQKIAELSKKISNDEIAYRAEFAKNERELRDGFSKTLEQKNALIAEKDAKIAELQKYEGMAGVKSIEEIGVIMPDRAIEMIEEIKANNESAHKSLFEYIMTGKGQEEFLKQIARNEYFVKARKDGIEKIPSVSTAIEQAANDGIRVLGFFSYETACEMLGNCLKTFANGDYIQVPAIYRQVRDNANSLLLPLLKQDEHYPYKTVEKEMQDAKKFQNEIKDAKLALAQKGYNYLSETRRGVSPRESYMTFVNNKDGSIRDYSLATLSGGNNALLGMYRLKDANGNVIRDDSNIKD